VFVDVRETVLFSSSFQNQYELCTFLLKMSSFNSQTQHLDMSILDLSWLNRNEVCHSNIYMYTYL